MRILNGAEIASFVKNRQLHQVRALRQHDHVVPKLAILTTSRPDHENLPIETYMRMKQRYGDDILVDVEVFRGATDELPTKIAELNYDPSTTAIIIQLPLENRDEEEEILNLVKPEKDVDALGKNAILDPATPTAINWLLAGYNVELAKKSLVIVGNGRLVGRPLAKMWRNSGLNVRVLDEPDFVNNETDFREALRGADVIITAVGKPGLIRDEDIKHGAIVVDAATSNENGKLVGDVADGVRENRSDLTITPVRGGVGPLTISALFDNVIRAAQNLTR